MSLSSLSGLKGQWDVAAQAAVWVGTAIGMFLFQPPVLTLSGDTGVDPARFAHFIFAVLAALSFQLVKQTVSSRAIRLRIAAGSAVASIVFFFAYMAALNNWTCPYAVHWQVVQGDRYTEDAREAAAALPSKGRNCAEVLQEYGGAAALVWDSSETKPRYLMIQALYLLLWISCAFALILALPATANQSTTSKSRGNSPRAPTL